MQNCQEKSLRVNNRESWKPTFTATQWLLQGSTGCCQLLWGVANKGLTLEGKKDIKISCICKLLKIYKTDTESHVLIIKIIYLNIEAQKSWSTHNYFNTHLIKKKSNIIGEEKGKVLILIQSLSSHGGRSPLILYK